MKRSLICSALALSLLAACESAPKTVAQSPAIQSHEDFQKFGTVSPAPKTGGTTAVPVAFYGQPLKMTEKDGQAVKDVLAKPADYAGKEMRMTGKVVAVCEKKGCWLTVGDPSTIDTVYVKFQDPPEGRLVPMEAKGHDVTVEGTLVQVNVSEAQAKHLAEDAGATDAQLEKIVGPQKMLFMKNPAVKIVGVAPSTQPAAE